MIITLDLEHKVVVLNNKIIDVDPIYAFALAPKGTIVTVIENDGKHITLDIDIPK